MKATEVKLLEFLRISPQFTIPIYQRTYSWTERECQQLWNDILRTGQDDSIAAHFVGSIVYIAEGIFAVASAPRLLVIDGQQRLTTIALILEALARHLGDEEPVDGFSAKKIRSYYLLNPLEDGDRRFKLLLTQTDRQSLLSLLQQLPEPQEASVCIKDNFEFFEKQINSLGSDLSPLCKGLAKLVMVDIALNRDQDNPQLIFESMNSTGRELSQADLIRNFILMGLEEDQQTRLYQQHWRPMEVAFGQKAYSTHFDSFMRHYLTLKTGEIPNVRGVYEAFNRHAVVSLDVIGGISALVADMHRYAGYYCAMALDKAPVKDLAEAFRDLRDLRVDVAYPFLLQLYDDFSKGILPASEFTQVVRLVEAYVFRRAVCAIPTNSLNKTFATCGRAIHKDRYIESVQAHFLTLPSYRRFPSNEEFKRELSTRDLYNFPRRSYLLRRLENYGHKEPISVGDYTIEHILPQNPKLSADWQKDLGPEWRRVQETWLHSLGNLTLTGYNPEYSDRPFHEKRDMQGGLKESPLWLNRGFGLLDSWNEITIQDRAVRLADHAVKVWAIPHVSESILDNYRPKMKALAGYTLEDHSQLAEGSPTRLLFETFRKEALALDPCVSEQVLKIYIAYKAETNFVDVVPQRKRLRLTLNMQFHELHDPKGIAKDVTGLGRWGNGDVQVGLNEPEDLIYIMSLVRQAFEKQMGETETDR